MASIGTREKLINHFMSRGLVSAIVQLILFLVFSLSTIEYQSVSSNYILTSLILVALIFVRGLFSSLYLKQNKKSQIYKDIVFLSVILSSIVWAINLLVWTSVNQPQYSDLVIYILIAGLTSAAVTSLSAQKTVALSFVLLQAVIVIVGSLFLDFHEHIASTLVINSCFVIYAGFIILQIISTNSDLKNRYEINEKLASENLILQNIMNAIPGNVSYLDKRLNYISVNTKLQSLYPTYNFKGRKLGDFGQGSDLVRFIENCCQKNISDVTTEIDLCINEIKRTHLLFFKKIDIPLSYVIITIDAQDSKDAEEQIKIQQDKIVQQSKLAELGEMAAGVAHEINNPLMIMNGRIYNIISNLKDEKFDQEKLKNSLESIRNASERIAKIVRGLKSFSRSSNEDPFVVDSLNKIIEETIAFMKPNLDKEYIKIKLQLTSLSNDLRCRPGQISQVIVNLVNNAMDAIKDANCIEREVLISTWVEGDSIKIKIQDSGPGIPKEIQDKIMQPFFTTKPVGQGTGLGLSITYGIIADHKGHISLDNQSNKTTFIIEFARADSVSVAS